MWKARSYLGPVKSFELYFSKLNPLSDSISASKKYASVKYAVWYDYMPLGHNKIGGMMKEISQKAGQSTIYTNHCIRVTTVTVLFQAGLEGERITNVTGNRSTTSLKPYIKAPTQYQKREASEILGKYASPVSEMQMAAPSSSVSSPEPATAIRPTVVPATEHPTNWFRLSFCWGNTGIKLHHKHGLQRWPLHCCRQQQWSVNKWSAPVMKREFAPYMSIICPGWVFLPADSKQTHDAMKVLLLRKKTMSQHSFDVIITLFLRHVSSGTESYLSSRIRQIEVLFDTSWHTMQHIIGILCGYAIRSGRHPEGSQRPPGRPQVGPGRWLPEGCLPDRMA